MEERDALWGPVPGHWRTTDSVFSVSYLRRVSHCAVLCGQMGLCHRNQNINKANKHKSTNQNQRKKLKNGEPNINKKQLQKPLCANSAKTRFCSIFELVSVCFSKTEVSAFHINNYEVTFSGHLAWSPTLSLLDNRLPCKWLLLPWTVSLIPLSCWKAFSESSPLEQPKKKTSEHGHVAESMAPFDLQAQSVLQI